MKWSATAASRFSTFFENPFVNRVNRRMDILMVRFCRSVKLVEMCAKSGIPLITARFEPMHCRSTGHQLFLTISLICLVLFFFSHSTPAAVTVTLGRNFTGSSYEANSQSIPADANGVVGPNHFMEFINGTVAVYNKSAGASVQRKSNAAFWADAGLIISSDAATTDPRVIYDPASQRWFATQIDFDANATDPTSEANNFLLAVSLTASPTGPWKGFKFQSDPDNGFFADFPTLGLDTNAVYISGDFYSAGEVPEGAGLVSIPKADLVGVTPTVAGHLPGRQRDRKHSRGGQYR
jgi:hypothetical protein